MSPLDDMRSAALNRVAPSRNGHSSGKPKGKVNRFTIVNAMIDQHLAALKASDAILWLVLWRFVDSKSGTVTISHSRLAELAGMTRRGVVKAITRMTAAGYVKRVRKGGPDHSSNIYRLALPPAQLGNHGSPELGNPECSN